MTKNAELKALYHKLLSSYQNGLSNTSTAKFDNVNAFFAKLLGIENDEVYSVSSGGRTTNLPIRLVQGAQATRHTTLGLGWATVTERRPEVSKVSSAALTTISNYVADDRCNYDAIGLIVVDEKEEPRLEWLMEGSASKIGATLQEHFPKVKLLHFPPGKSGAADVLKGGGESQPSKKAEVPAGAPILKLVAAAHGALNDAGMRVSIEVVHRYYAALLTKPFVILSGLSGSGKTRFAEALARWMSTVPEDQVLVLSVGSDWTSNEHLVGYPDALDSSRYEVTPTVQLLLRAAKPENASRPFFLVLDEMNLSHVERYFSDFLSVIERDGAIDLYSGAKRGDVPNRLPLPKNVFVIGTINVDETTYQFSPKVLDRANVFEFRSDAVDMRAVLEAQASVEIDTIATLGSVFGAPFVSAAAQQMALPDEDAVWMVSEAMKIYRVVEAARREFGYRTGAEMMRFASAHRFLAPTEWHRGDALDAQLLQKLLPRIGGSRSSIEPLIWALTEYARSETTDDQLDQRIISPMRKYDPALDPMSSDGDAEVPNEVDAFLPLSHAKLLRLASRVREGFVSFFEA